MDRRNSLILAGICLFSTLLWGTTWFVERHFATAEFLPPLVKAEWSSDDLRMQLGTRAPQCDKLVFLGIDQPNYTDVFSPEELEDSEPLRLMCRQFPWSRKLWAEAIHRLSEAGAEVIILDLLFFSPGEGDAELAAAVRKHSDKVVLAANIMDSSVDHFTKTSITWPSETIYTEGARPQIRVGFANFWPDLDGTIRHVNYSAHLSAFAQPIYTLSGQALAISGNWGNLPNPTGTYRFRYAGPPGKIYKQHPIYELFLPSTWRNNFKNGDLLKGKIVIIGPAGDWTQDLKRTPYTQEMLGPELHIQALGAALTRSFLYESGTTANIGLLLLAGLGSFLVLYFAPHPLSRLALLLGGTASYAGLAQLAYNRAGWVVLLVPPLLIFNTGGALGLLYEYFQALLDRIRTRSTFEKYVSKNVVNAILDQSKDFEKSLGGTRKPCAMLFSDIRGFTTMTEMGDSHLLVTQLNEYLTEMVECVFRYDGTLDKFIGDAVMAVWGNVQSLGPEEDCDRAVNCAIDMMQALELLNKQWEANKRPPLHIGIGINFGEVIVGNMGSPRRKEFTVIGDAVNLASRLEGVTKEYEVPIILGENAAPLLRGRWRLQTVDLIRVKGKTRPVDTFTLLGKTGSPFDDRQSRALALYESAMVAFRAGSFEKARAQFEESRDLWPGNGLAGFHAKRAAEMALHPVPENWIGVCELKTK